MPTLAATSAPDTATYSHMLAGLITAAIVALVILTAGYLVRCWLFPFTTCHHDYAFNRRVCRRCEGTSRRLRAGRRLLNHVRAARRHH